MLDDPPHPPTDPWWAWGRRALLFLLLPLLAVVLSACGKATPLCDQAASLAASARLGPATEKYAEASERGEGECAETGLVAAGSRYADAFRNVARAWAAERDGNVEAAATAYRAALTYDADNAVARDGLTRLAQPVPEVVPPEPAATPAPAPPEPVATPTPEQPAPAATPAATPAPSTLLVGLTTAAVGLLVTVLGLISLTERRRRRDVRTATKAALLAEKAYDDRHRTGWSDTATALDELRTTVAAMNDEVRLSREQLASGLRELHEQEATASTVRRDVGTAVRAAVEDTSSRLKDAVDTVAQQCAALERQLDEVIDYVGDAMRDSARPVHDRYVRREG